MHHVRRQRAGDPVTAHLPCSPPLADVDALLHDLDETGELWPAVERRLRTMPKPPPWAKVLGPWMCVEQDGRVWRRNPLHPDPYAPTIAVEQRGESWHQHALGILRYDTRNEAMRAEDEFAGQQGWLVVGGGPPPEEPAPAPGPAEEAEEARAPCITCGGDGVDDLGNTCWNCQPFELAEHARTRAQAARRGAGRRAGQHRWAHFEVLAENTKRSVFPVTLDRCVDCQLWRVGGRRYFAENMRVEAVRLLWREDGAGAAKAGRCAPRTEGT